jgi:prevent-host-death family protein
MFMMVTKRKMETVRIGIAEIRTNMADALKRVVCQGERVILNRRGKEIAAIVSLEDLALLEALEGGEEVLAARKALAKMKRKGQKLIPLDEIKRRLGM